MKIAVLPGDGIGVDVTAQAVKVLRAALGPARYEFTHGLIGGAAFDATGSSLPPATIELIHAADAILLGATGTPEDEHRPPAEAVGRSTLLLREELQLFANFRPAFLYPELIGASTLKPEVIRGLDLIILRELNGDVYYGQPRGIATDASGERYGFNTMRYSESEVERIGRNQRAVAGSDDASGPRVPRCGVIAHVRGRGGDGADAQPSSV
jgi:3-isopropylmalate dehydrogenase